MNEVMNGVMNGVTPSGLGNAAALCGSLYNCIYVVGTEENHRFLPSYLKIRPSLISHHSSHESSIYQNLLSTILLTSIYYVVKMSTMKAAQWDPVGLKKSIYPRS